MSDLGKQIYELARCNKKAELKALLESHTDAEVANAINSRDWEHSVSPAVSESLHAGPHGDSDGVERVHALDHGLYPWGLRRGGGAASRVRRGPDAEKQCACLRRSCAVVVPSFLRSLTPSAPARPPASASSATGRKDGT